MRKSLVVVVCMLLGASSCIGGGGTNHTVLIDYSSDEFASFVLKYFPSRIEAHPGDSLVIHQTWTGEPHTFSSGKLYRKVIEDGAAWFALFESYTALQSAGVAVPEDPDNAGDLTIGDIVKTVQDQKDQALARRFFDSIDALTRAHPKLPKFEAGSQTKFTDFAHVVDDESNKVFESFPSASDDNGNIRQGSAQPCFLKKGAPPKDPKKACTKAQHKQTPFDGTESFYSSGIIPYSGPQGNTFRVPLAKNIKPGRYFFFCLVHGPQQRTEVIVRPKGSKVESSSAVSRRVKDEIDATVEPLQKQWREVQRGSLMFGGEKLTPPFAGLADLGETAINAFVPKTVRAKVDEPITWKMMGADHTIAFEPPKYFPPIQFEEDGTVRYNPKLRPPAGGAKKFPGQNGPPTGPVKFDGGTYNGSGFWSSGLISAQPYLEYTMRISNPGTYNLACLIHPTMVGTVVVSR